VQIKHLLLSFLLLTNLLFAQDILVGVNGSVGIINTNSMAGIGVGINGEYRFASYPFSVRLSAKIYNASFDDSPYLQGYTHTFKTGELNLLYVPFKGMMQPYIGLGTGYNIVDIKLSGNVTSVDGKSILSRNAQNNFNYNLVVGTGIASEKTLSFFLELLYSHINIDHEVEFIVDRTVMNSSEELNKIYLNAGIKIRL